MNKCAIWEVDQKNFIALLLSAMNKNRLITNCDGHHRCRDTEGQGEAVVLVQTPGVPEVGSQHGADHGSGVDGGVEPGEVVAQHGLLFWKLELLGSEGGHARLDAASAERDEEQADERDGPTQKRQKGNSETQMSKHILRNYLSKK